MDLAAFRRGEDGSLLVSITSTRSPIRVACSCSSSSMFIGCDPAVPQPPPDKERPPYFGRRGGHKFLRIEYSQGPQRVCCDREHGTPRDDAEQRTRQRRRFRANRQLGSTRFPCIGNGWNHTRRPKPARPSAGGADKEGVPNAT